MHIFFGLFATIGFVAIVWGATRIITKWFEAKVCMSQIEFGQRQLEFQRKQHQDMVFFRREQLDRMGMPFSGLGPRSRNDPDQQH